MQQDPNYIYPESTWQVRLISALCVSALVGGAVALMNYSYKQHAPQAKGDDLPLVEVSFFADDLPAKLSTEQSTPTDPVEEVTASAETQTTQEELIEESVEETEVEPEAEVEPEVEPTLNPEPVTEPEPEVVVKPQPKPQP